MINKANFEIFVTNLVTPCGVPVHIMYVGGAIYTVTLTVYVIVLQNAPSTSKEIDSSLKSRKYLVVSQSGIAFAGYPHTGICVCIYFILNKLPSALQNVKKKLH